MAFTVDLTGHAALVTGAARGIGAHFAMALARAGAKVAAADVDEAGLAETVAAIRAGDGRAVPVHIDMRDEDSIAKGVEMAETELGCIDILINNAGIAPVGRSLDFSVEDWDATMQINLRGLWLMANAFARHAVQHQHGGAIVNMASIAGLRPAATKAAYGVSKAGVAHLTRILALEWAEKNIRVNALAPGFIQTPLTEAILQTPEGQAGAKTIPMGRVGTPDDLEGAMLLLVSDAGSYMTGSVLTIDGGRSLLGM